VYELKDGQLEECGLSAYKKYKHRLDEVEDITFLDFLLHFNHTNYKRRPRAKPRVISYFPCYKGDPCHLQYPHFCRIKLLLHHPWREYEEVATCTDEFGAPDYIASYQAYVASHQHLPDYFCIRTVEEACEAAADIDEFDDHFADNLELYQSFEILHAHIRNTDVVEVEDPDKLGDRELDRDYNWGTYRGTCPQLDKRAYWQDIRLQPLQQSHLLQTATLSSLQSAQRHIYDVVVGHYRQIQIGLSPPPLRINIDGVAGTGKSHLIAVFSATLHDIAMSNGKPSPLVRAASTGVAGFNINGRTTYELLWLSVNCPFEELPIASLMPL
jgi:ATP-dependent DNA helicase PIF1